MLLLFLPRRFIESFSITLLLYFGIAFVILWEQQLCDRQQFFRAVFTQGAQSSNTSRSAESSGAAFSSVSGKTGPAQDMKSVASTGLAGALPGDSPGGEAAQPQSAAAKRNAGSSAIALRNVLIDHPSCFFLILSKTQFARTGCMDGTKNALAAFCKGVLGYQQ